MISKVSKSPKRDLVRAVAYIRMSTGRQEKSPAQQKTELKRFAEREGYDIIAWYDRDKGITGDSGIERRPDFARMLEAAAGRQFEVLLAWDVFRIGRFNSLDAGRWLHVLRDAGIKIHSVCEGLFNLNNEFDRQKLAWLMESGNAENVKRAGSVLRGMVDAASKGFACGGRKYGLARGEFTPDGTLVRCLGKDEQKQGKRNYVGWVLGDNQAELDAIAYAFQRFDSADISFRSLARELEELGYPQPGQGINMKKRRLQVWQSTHVVNILTNPIYAGLSRWGSVARGRYFSLEGDTITRRPLKDMPPEKKPDESTITSKSTVKPLVAQDLFDRVQVKVAKRRAGPARKRQGHVLSGLVFCGHCGSKMYGDSFRDKKGGKVRLYKRFRCGDYKRLKGSPKGSACGSHSIDPDDLLRWLVERLKALLLGPAREELVAEIARQLKAEAKAGEKRGTEKLEQRLAELDVRIERLRDAIMLEDDKGLTDRLRQAKGERKRLAEELARAGRFVAAADIAAEAERIAGLAWSLGERLQDADPEALRATIMEVVDRIELRWTEKTNQKAKRRNCELVGGEVITKDSDILLMLWGNDKFG